MKARPSMEKRRKEMQRQERKQRKAERREQRKTDHANRPEIETDEDPDLAGIVVGPQPIPREVMLPEDEPAEPEALAEEK